MKSLTVLRAWRDNSSEFGGPGCRSVEDAYPCTTGYAVGSLCRTNLPWSKVVECPDP